MTAYELRRHLAHTHDIRLIGADYGTLLTVHDIEHRAAQDHTHDTAGHTAPDFLWVIVLILAILVALKYLGVHI